MKSLGRILRRYVLSAAGVGLILLMLNFAVLLAFGIKAQQSGPETKAYVRTIAQGLTQEDGAFRLTAEARAALDARYAWAMLLDDGAQVIWADRLPDDVPHAYTASEVASFSRWYLRDYPVYVWEHPAGLLVLGSPRGSEWKYTVTAPETQIRLAVAWLPGVLLLNLGAALLVALLLGLRLFRSVKPVAQGVGDLAEGKPVQLQTGGLLGALASDLNRASAALSRQRGQLAQRDHTRTSWIAGVSHDIRTPLSMVMGYAGQLEEDKKLPDEARGEARIIRQQSERIRDLVSDLNLASKLAYRLQPLHPVVFSPAALLRRVAADTLNGGLAGRCTLALDTAGPLEALRLTGDEHLIARAVQNLVTNSIVHNPEGCAVRLQLSADDTACTVAVRDNGRGYPAEVLRHLAAPVGEGALPAHGLGLVLVREIAAAHGGTAEFMNTRAGAYAALTFPRGL